MRRLLLLWVGAVALAGAQPKPDQREFTLMLDQIRAAIRAEDWPEASRLSMRLSNTLLELRSRSQGTPGLELQHLEMLAGKDSITRNPLLPRMARAAFEAGEWPRAEALAREALEAAKWGVFWWTGDAIHQGNIILGRLALRESKVEAAKRFLLAAGRTPGSRPWTGLAPIWRWPGTFWVAARPLPCSPTWSPADSSGAAIAANCRSGLPWCAPA
jgi:hypothetical protein